MVGLGAGLVLGMVYFGGLWLTSTRINRSRHAPLLTAGSFLGRCAIILAGLYLVIRFVGLIGIVSTLPGFVVMQLFFIRRAMKGTSTR